MEKPKNFVTVLMLPIILAASVLVQSCAAYDDQAFDDSVGLPEAIVTVKTNGSGITYFQLDSVTTLEPFGWENTYGREVRAFLDYSELPYGSDLFSKLVRVEAVDTILTKNAVSSRDKDFISMSDDPLELIADWMTCCEDGYLTIHFAAQAQSSYIGKVFHVELGVSPSDPHELRLKHDLNGDTSIILSEGIAAFRLDEILGDSVSEGDTLTLKWLSFSGDKSAQIRYSGRIQMIE